MVEEASALSLTARYYMSISVMAAGLALHSALSSVTMDEENPSNATSGWGAALGVSEATFDKLVEGILGSVLSQLALANLACACLYHLYILVVKQVFGEVTAAEQKAVNEAMVHHMYFQAPILLMMGQMSWVVWSLLLSFIKMVSILAIGRVDVMLASLPASNVSQYEYAVLLLLLILQFLVFAAFHVVGKGVILDQVEGALRTSYFIILSYEVVMQNIEVVKCYWRFGVHVLENTNDALWEQFGQMQCIIDLFVAVLSSLLVLLHVMHLWWLNQLSFGIVDMILLVNTKVALQKFATSLVAFRNFQRILEELDTVYTDATPAELEELRSSEEVCAICLKEMTHAKKLKCRHFFHKSCLLHWLQRSSNDKFLCPMCRCNLRSEDDTKGNEHGSSSGDPPVREMDNHVFRISTDDLPSWVPLPSFTFELVNEPPHPGFAPVPPHGHQEPVNAENEGNLHSDDVGSARNHEGVHVTAGTTAIDEMTQQVLAVFPSMPRELIIRDLERTHTAELTIENILEGRVTY